MQLNANEKGEQFYVSHALHTMNDYTEPIYQQKGWVFDRIAMCIG